jgi:protein-S-isoprenylcysteine O-methyltransferase Ste14
MAYLVLAAGSALWFLPLLWQRRRRRSAAAQSTDARARWGILLVAVAYAIPWQSAFRRSPAADGRLALAAGLFAVACAFSWSAARALGRHWRIEAGLDAEHELVRSGAYALVRHPIYTSMFLVVAATCLILAPLALLPLSLALYALGTAIRVRVEERLLADRFGEAFELYRRRVPAYIPRLTPR